jgi:fermentation-respiration switch protein FrsA (DUF1100 family)
MSGKTTAFSTGFMQAALTGVFSSAEISGLFANSASPLTNLFMSLHTADPGVGGTQSTNEVTYTGYARVAIPRTTAGWSVTGEVASLLANAVFPTCTAAPGSAATFIGIGQSSSGTGELMYSGALSSNLNIAIGAAPIVASGSTITEA